MKTYRATVTLVFDNTGIQAKNKKEFISKLKDSFAQEFMLDISDKEITKIEIVKEDK